MLGFGDANCDIAVAEPGFVCPGSVTAGGSVSLAPPAPPPVPAGALDPSGVLLDPSGNPIETPQQAQALVDALAYQEFLQTEANVTATASGGTPSNVPLPKPVTPFCGSGSTQWISGVDNCVVLSLGAVAFLAFATLSGGRRRR